MKKVLKIHRSIVIIIGIIVAITLLALTMEENCPSFLADVSRHLNTSNI